MSETKEMPVCDPHKWIQKFPHEEFVGLLREQAYDTANREPGSAKWMLEAARRIDDLADRLNDCTTGPGHG
jgi:hypothetical protein